MGARRICLDCGAHAFDRWCSVCGGERLEPLGRRFEGSVEAPPQPVGAEAAERPAPDLAERRAV